MVKAKLIALLLLMATVAVAQKEVNHLVYKSTNNVETKKGTEKSAGMGVGVKVNDKQVVITRLKEDGSFNENHGYRIYDREKDVIIYDLARSEQYMIEKADSVVRNPAIAKVTAKTATINGYACKAYEATKDWYMFGKLQGTYTYTFWVTESILTDESINDQIVPAFTMNNATFSFKGTLVKVDAAYIVGKQKGVTSYELVKSEYSDDANKPVEMPWMRKGAKALLPNTVAVSDPNSNSYGTTHGYTAETPLQLRERLRALLTTVTGIEKPKFMDANFSGFIY